MSFEKMMQIAQQYMSSMEALAVLGAMCRADSEQLVLAPPVEQLGHEVLQQIGIEAQDLATLAPEQRLALVGMIRSFFRQADDFLENPSRIGAWQHTDPVILQSQGRGSMALAPIISQIVPQLGNLSQRLSQPGSVFLDLGTGVGLLAVALAQAFPNLQVVGIDIWKPALELAAKNIADLEGRVTLREQDACKLNEESMYDAVFVPGPFLPQPLIPAILTRVKVALRPEGWVFFGLYSGTESSLSASLTDLRVVRSGGYPWKPEEVLGLLDKAGFNRVQEIERTWAMPMTFVVACQA